MAYDPHNSADASSATKAWRPSALVTSTAAPRFTVESAPVMNLNIVLEGLKEKSCKAYFANQINVGKFQRFSRLNAHRPGCRSINLSQTNFAKEAANALSRGTNILGGHIQLACAFIEDTFATRLNESQKELLQESKKLAAGEEVERGAWRS